MAGELITGANGYINTFTVLLLPHDPLPGVPAGVFPHADEVTYRAIMSLQPGVVGISGVSVKPPPSILYSTVNPATGDTDGSVNADAQVLAGAVITGAVGKITTLTVLLFPHTPVPGVPAAVPPQAAVIT